MIVHIGLGKTATTSLQKSVFPAMLRAGLIEEYNPQHIMVPLRRYVVTGEGESYLKQAIAELPDQSIISFESLYGWNPEIWAKSLARNALIFPKKTKIIITLRDPESYLKSVYIQMLHEGLVVKPEEFFISNERYESVKPMVRSELGEIFKIDDFCYQSLVTMYARCFDEVVLTPLSTLSRLEFLKAIIPITENEIEELRASFLSAKKENVSYSDRAIKLTFLRKRVLDAFSLKEKSSFDRFFENFFNVAESKNSVDSRKKELFSKVVSKVGKFFTWRIFMQKIVDRCLPYRKYSFPENLYLGKMMSDNKLYYKNIIKEDGGFRHLKANGSEDSQ